MAAPFNNLRSKLDRACVAYLTGKLPARKNAAGQNVIYIYPANWSAQMDDSNGPIIRVRSHGGRPSEESQLSGNWQFSVQFSVEAPAAQQMNQANPAAQRVSNDAVMAAMCDALATSTDLTTYQATADAITAAGRALVGAGSEQEQANNADMADFTLQFWLPTALDGGNPVDESGNANTATWIEHVMFRADCCASNVS